MRKLVLSALILSVYPLVGMGQTTVGAWTYIVENSGATITASTATGNVTIPSVLGGYAVKKVGNGMPPIFGVANISVTSVVIPNSVTSIGGYAFAFCYNLISVTIPESVTNIGSFVFNGCHSLLSVTIPNGVPSIGEAAFMGCYNLISVIIPNSVTSIGFSAFGLCFNLISVTIPNSVTSIEDYAFDRCTILQRVFLPARFGTTYQNFSLTSSQVIFYDASNLAPIYLAGQQSVIANPNTHNLYTTSQIHYMAMGDLVLTRQEDGIFVLNYDIEQSNDLQTWTPYEALSLSLTRLPEDKAFVRIQMLNSTPNPPPSTAVGSNF